MNFQIVLIWDDRGDEHQIAVRTRTSVDDAMAKATSYARDELYLNVEGAGEGDVVEMISGGMTAIN